MVMSARDLKGPALTALLLLLAGVPMGVKCCLNYHPRRPASFRKGYRAAAVAAQGAVEEQRSDEPLTLPSL